MESSSAASGTIKRPKSCVSMPQLSAVVDATSRLASDLVWASFFHVLGLFMSILLYRRFFRCLKRANFPGPRWARYTKIWQIWENRNSRNHIYLHGLRQRPDDVVRTGPSEATVFLPEAHEAVGGRQSECVKSEFYDLLWPAQAIFAARDKAVHVKRRKDWQYGFSSGAMEHHKRKVLEWVDELDSQLAKKAKARSTVNVAEYFLWFTYVIMGSFTFSNSFGMLERQEWHGEDCFVEGTKFIPERWSTRPEMVLHLAVHMPFSIGENLPQPCMPWKAIYNQATLS
ncbi:cytochrome P450 [Apiospora saccharicola]